MTRYEAEAKTDKILSHLAEYVTDPTTAQLLLQLSLAIMKERASDSTREDAIGQP